MHYIEFNIGNTVVCPHHGAAKIENIIEQEPNGETVQYLVLQILQSDLNIQVSARNAKPIGIRDVVGKGGLLKIFSVLREAGVKETGNWPRCYRANQERLNSSGINGVVEVVRDLWRRDQNRDLSAGERRMLSKACQVLVGELTFAGGVDEAKVEEVFAHVDVAIERHRALAQEDAVGERKDEADDEPVDLDAGA